MRFFYNSITFIFLNIITCSLIGQTLHYSQFFSSPLHLNPALTGVIDSDWRFVNNSRSQGQYFGNPMRTISVSYDKSIHFYKSTMGIGALYSYDNSAGSTFPASKFYISGASMVRISENSYLGGGLQVGWVSRSLTYSQLTFPEQYDRDKGGFNPSLPMSENFPEKSSNYLDVNMGVLWNFKGEKFVLSSGLAAYHLNTPKDYFLDEDSQLKIRTNWHGSLRYQLNEQFYILPQSYFTLQNKTSEWVLGSSVGMQLDTKNEDFKSMSLGLYIRDGFGTKLESAILMVGLSYRNWTAMTSIDIDVSGLKTQHVFSNALELSLIYQRPWAVLKKRTIPCVRF
ncbi:PorP/SprF family type IX secretion system membrane protein [Saccharicrinis fermentans]|uniref:Bacteroidetes-specific putative membrane protein n=1 Tax=Saccharicrinis fermentans DSM 9555 = JCM 21142 TaxID=869213 RepID=W7YCM8_9BACT|nr:PorP/SprF family type IX secretion system membrane protein [Saccharicrinis fermentans]GAF02216.1 bacteroidetes-specific putative membrane protein [Saccharicrinis fermentans DSM 9555 = JCM 21142]